MKDLLASNNSQQRHQQEEEEALLQNKKLLKNEEEGDGHYNFRAQPTHHHLSCSLSSFQALLIIFVLHWSLSLSLSTNSNPTMENPPPGRRFTGIFFIIIISILFGIISFISCIVAEFKRNKKEDLRWNGRLCFMPSSPAFGFGIAALVSLFFAQFIGNSAFLMNSCSGGKRNVSFKIPAISKALLLISWLSFGVAVTMLISATSMSRRQRYGEGWLNGECYIVRGGTYVGSAMLILVALASCTTGSLLSTVMMMKTTQAEENRKVHAQMG